MHMNTHINRFLQRFPSLKHRQAEYQSRHYNSLSASKLGQFLVNEKVSNFSEASQFNPFRNEFKKEEFTSIKEVDLRNDVETLDPNFNT